MKVLYDHQIFTTQKFGGISRYFKEIMKMDDPAFAAETIDTSLFPQQPEKTTQPDLFSRGINYLKRRAGLNSSEQLNTIPQKVSGQIREGNFDIFHPTYYNPYFVEYLSKPFVLTVYDMIHEIYKESFSIDDPTSRNKRLLCDKAAAILAISHNTKEDLVNIFRIDEKKIHAIPLASDFDTVQAREPEGTKGISNYILFTGSRWLYKNFYFTAIALADILKQDNSMQLLCTGHHFSSAEMLFFRDLGIDGQVHHLYLKNDQELAWAYKNARVFIFPSLYEGFGFPLLEAFACDCPVVASRGGSLAEVGGDGALFFDPKNIVQIQDAVSRVLYSPGTRADMIQKGRQQFNRYSWATCRTDTLQVYDSVFSGNH